MLGGGKMGYFSGVTKTSPGPFQAGACRSLERGCWEQAGSLTRSGCHVATRARMPEAALQERAAPGSGLGCLQVFLQTLKQERPADSEPEVAAVPGWSVCAAVENRPWERCPACPAACGSSQAHLPSSLPYCLSILLAWDTIVYSSVSLWSALLVASDR